MIKMIHLLMIEKYFNVKLDKLIHPKQQLVNHQYVNVTQTTELTTVPPNTIAHRVLPPGMLQCFFQGRHLSPTLEGTCAFLDEDGLAPCFEKEAGPTLFESGHWPDQKDGTGTPHHFDHGTGRP